MKTVNTWSYKRYRPAVHGDDTVYINRVVPGDGDILLYHNGGADSGVFWRRRADTADCKTSDTRVGRADNRRLQTTDAADDLPPSQIWSHSPALPDSAHIRGLDNGTDYEFYIKSPRGLSLTGTARPGTVPGTVVNYLSMHDPKYKFAGQYLCTPCLLSHPDGYLLASMDLYERAAPQNLTVIFRSDDGGESWYHVSELFPCYWGTLFMHRGELYMLGTSTEYGDLLIGKSTDGGYNWLTPTVLHRGACNRSGPGWHKGSGRVTEHAGRLWCAVDYGSHVIGTHASALISAPVLSDLLDSSSWVITDPLSYDPKWEGASQGDNRGFIEGCAVVGCDGNLYNFLRYNIDRGTPNHGLAGILRADTASPEATLSHHCFVSFPGNHSKFDIVRDDVSGRYYSIISRIYDSRLPKARNLLSLVASANLTDWTTVADLIDYRDHDPAMYGFQYVSFLIDGEDIIYLCRTADNGAHSYHDSNYITFHRIKNFRALR